MSRWYCEPVVRLATSGHVVIDCTCTFHDELGISPTAAAVIYAMGKHDVGLEERVARLQEATGG